MAKGTFIQNSRRKSPAEKAAYHQMTGAGTSKVRREFFGLTPTDEDAIVNRINSHLDRALKGTR